MKQYLLFLLLILVLSGSAAYTFSKEITLEFWNGFTGPDGRYIQKVVDGFNDEYQGRIKVNMVVMVWGDFYNKLALALRTRRGPDIGIVHYDQVCNVIYQGIALELDPYLDRFAMNDFAESALQVSRRNGHQYGIPLDFHPFVFYWNKDVFARAGLDAEKPPANRQEFLQYCQVIKQAELKNGNLQIWPFAVSSITTSFQLWQQIFFCNGGVMFNKDYNQALYNGKEGLDALQFMWDLIYKYQYSPKNMTPISVVDNFRRGNSAMLLDGVWMLNAFRETDNLNFGAIAAINVGKPGACEHKVWTGSHTMVIFKKRYHQPEKINASIEFLKYISDHSYKWALSGMMPVRYSVLQSEQFKQLEYLPKIAEDIDKFKFPVPNYRYMDGVSPFSDEYINLCLVNKLSAVETLQRASDVSNKQLQADTD